MFISKTCHLFSYTTRHLSSKIRSHYDSLGVKSSATQAEIKTAYYALSKMFHPDTNQGSEESLTKFRQVTDAYEVLGNVKTRRLYDRGLVVGGHGTTLRQEPEEDDPTTRFYKKREKRHQVPTAFDRTTVYDFDAWARAHYLHTKDRRSAAKSKNEEKLKIKLDAERVQSEHNSFMSFIIIMFLIFTAFGFLQNENYDKPAIVKKEAKES